MRKSVAVTIVVFLGIVLLVSIVVPLKVGQSLFVVKAYFPDAHGLKPGAQVRMGGMVVGRVTRVRVRPALGERPIEVVMVMRTGYNRIPDDAVISLSQLGLLRETIAEIDTRNATGRPIQSGGILQTRASQGLH
jgi:phospholipid/cholesterol/gamma-HCH transport system substrate-binding protein